MLNKISVNIIWVTYSHQKLITFEKLSSLKYLPMTYFCPYDENMLMQSCNIYKKTKKRNRKKGNKRYGRSNSWELSMFILCSFFLFRPSEYSLCLFFVHSFLFRTLLSMFLQIGILKMHVNLMYWECQSIYGSKSWSNLLISFGTKDVFSSAPDQRISRKVNIVLVTGEITEQYMGFMEFQFHSLF